LAATVRIIAAPISKANCRAKLEYSPAEEENSRYPKHCIWRPSPVNTWAVTRVKPLCNVAMKAPPAAACMHCTSEALLRAQAATGL